MELAPKRPFGSVGVLRVRPLPRGRVMARREAAFCEEAANQRWYRVNYALCPKGQGAFSMDSITQTERLRRRGTRFVFYAAVLYSIGGLCIKVIPWNAMSINSGRNILSMLPGGLQFIQIPLPRGM